MVHANAVGFGGDEVSGKAIDVIASNVDEQLQYYY
jgi:hypothetical protein